MAKTISKEDILNIIIQLQKEGIDKVPKTRIKDKIGRSKQVDDFLEELVKEGKLIKEKSGNSILYYVKQENNEDHEENKLEVKENKIDEPKINEMFSDIINYIQDIRKILLKENTVDSKKFDEIYGKTKDSDGYSKLSAIRIEMGLTKEAFYSTYGEYIESKYQLYPGGEEGLTRKGNLYGIIKLK
ncbi:hypothetical protein DFR85_13740 [Acidianus brierleyi]|nr:hypothetical protein DFR85_13740 [Acidianus brierleyi]